MGRPPIPRRVGCRFGGQGFKPMGRPACELERVTLTLDQLEALRLTDLEGLYQEAAAERMGVSRPTFARILTRARASVADALVHAKVLLVREGPVVESDPSPEPCPVHWGGRRRGRGCRCDHGGKPGASDERSDGS